MSHLFGPDQLTKAAFRMRTKRPALPKRVRVRRGHIVQRDKPNVVPFNKVHRAKFGAANARRVLQHFLEYGLQVAGSAADDLKDF
jgi:hypothetical protein